jgi:hypothetical protein
MVRIVKKSSKVTLTLMAALGAAGCGHRGVDPCDAATYNDAACLQAVKDGGYYWGGSWVPRTYYQPYSYYHDSYGAFVDGGGAEKAAPAGAYSSSGDPAGVTRGGFGETGAAHGAGE